jgi:2-methylisocitrate lyase-like PEP mutase family enzyme
MGGAAQLRSLMAGGDFIAAPGAYDAFSARIIENVGFPAVYLGGNAIGLHLGVGQPFVTLTETVQCIRNTLASIYSPLIVDAGAGFGEPAHVWRAVREIERAGAAALHIDDQPYPKRAGYHAGRGQLASADDAAAKLKVACEARHDPDFMIIARTDALRVTKSLEEAAKRCHAYKAAGAEAIMVLDLAPEQVAPLKAMIPDIPLIWFVSPATQPPPTAVLREAGFRMAFYPFNTIAAVADAVTHLWTSLRDEGRLDQDPARVATLRNSVQDLIGMKTYWDIESRDSGAGSH